MIDLPGDPLTEEQRRPLIDADGRRLLTSLLEHAQAPRYNHTCGDRLTADGLAAVRDFDVEVRTTPPATAGRRPSWLEPFAAHCLRSIPVYRRHGAGGAWTGRFEDLPTVGRDALVREPWTFVPDDHPLDEMVVFTTTGTSGGGVAYIASSPVTTAGYAVMLRAALATRGLDLVGGPGRTAVAQVCWQRSTYTYASVSSFLDQAAIVKLNLNPAEWKEPSDVAAFLDAIQPEVFTGDPVAFAHLAELPLTWWPKALLSSAIALTAASQQRLEEHFGCPVIDVYGMNEAGPIAALLPDRSGHFVIQPRLYVEILGPDGRPVPLGERGEIVLTGGFNPALPLLRYRTGDHAALSPTANGQVLVGLEGRGPVPFATADGRAVNTIDVTVALQAFPLARYRVHQRADRSLDVGVEATGSLDEPALREVLADLFGPLPVDIRSMAGEPEQVPYSTDLADLAD